MGLTCIRPIFLLLTVRLGYTTLIMPSLTTLLPLLLTHLGEATPTAVDKETRIMYQNIWIE
jgi:hypothetical protein